MADTKDIELLNRQIAADLLQTLISNGQIRLSGPLYPEVVVQEVGQAYRDLLAEIEAKRVA